MNTQIQNRKTKLLDSTKRTELLDSTIKTKKLTYKYVNHMNTHG